MSTNRSLASAAYTISPPSLLSCSLSTRPADAESTGVPRGAMMSSASCVRVPPPRFSLNVSRSSDAFTPGSGMISSKLSIARSAGVVSAALLSETSPSAVEICGSGSGAGTAGREAAATVSAGLVYGSDTTVSLLFVERALSPACSITTLQPNDAAASAASAMVLVTTRVRERLVMQLPSDYSRKRTYARIAPNRALAGLLLETGAVLAALRRAPFGRLHRLMHSRRMRSTRRTHAGDEHQHAHEEHDQPPPQIDVDRLRLGVDGAAVRRDAVAADDHA